MDRKEYQKEWAKKKRLSTKVLTEVQDLSTKPLKVSTGDGVSTKNVTLSDGQVLRLGNHGYIGEDKFTGYQCPKSWGTNWVGFQQAMKASNRAQYLEPLAIRNKVKLDKVAELLECTADRRNHV